MLTGICKQDFEEYLKNNDHTPWLVFFDGIPDTVKNAYMIEWFDSVAVYISIEPNFHIFEKGNPFSCFRFFIDMIHYGQADTRQEATKSAIEKANELYNEKFK